MSLMALVASELQVSTGSSGIRESPSSPWTDDFGLAIRVEAIGIGCDLDLLFKVLMEVEVLTSNAIFRPCVLHFCSMGPVDKNEKSRDS